jgi:ATP-dependent Clp protease adaptor protein ClpS
MIRAGGSPSQGAKSQFSVKFVGLKRASSLVFGLTRPYKGVTPGDVRHWLLMRDARTMANDLPQNPNEGHDSSHGLVLEEATPKLKKPPLFEVLLLNDDYTPMEFVVEVLEKVFAMDRMKSTRIMLEVHTKGKAVCGVFTFEIAETKVAQVTAYARQHQHPLLCTMEEVS